MAVAGSWRGLAAPVGAGTGAVAVVTTETVSFVNVAHARYTAQPWTCSTNLPKPILIPRCFGEILVAIPFPPPMPALLECPEVFANVQARFFVLFSYNAKKACERISQAFDFIRILGGKCKFRTCDPCSVNRKTCLGLKKRRRIFLKNSIAYLVI